MLKIDQNIRLHFRAYFDAHLYCDIWSQVLADELLPASEESNFLDAMVEHLKRGSEGLSLQDVEACQEILYACNAQLGMEDAIKGGCGSKRLLNGQARVESLELDHKWDKSLAIHDLKLSTSQQADEDGSLHTGEWCREILNNRLCS